jgi:thiol-disulfide isomerase/thioredoxin
MKVFSKTGKTGGHLCVLRAPALALRRPPLQLLIIFVFAILSACRGGTSFPTKSAWSGRVELGDGVIVPVQMNLDFSGAKPSGYFIVGDEKTPIPEITRDNQSVVLGFSEYSAEVRASWDGEELVGNYLRIRADGTKSLKFAASPVTGFANEPAGNAPVGNYQVYFQGEDKVDDTTVAKLWVTNNSLYGTLIAPDGDYGLLTGRRLGNGFQLSRFTGWQAITVVIEPESGAWSGKFYAASNAKPKPLILQPRADLNVPVPAAMRTVMKNPKSEFAFSGISLSGETVRNTDDRFKGKALVIDIMGTWCHNCLDEAPLLQKLQQQFGKDGLEVVGLSFEISNDPALAKKNLQLYKDRFGLTYTLLFCGSLDDANVDKQVRGQLDNFFAYPTAIFTDNNHKVQSIHSGFKGPGTGDEYQLQIREFQDLGAKLVGKIRG